MFPKHSREGEKEKVSHAVVSDVLLCISLVDIVLRRLHFLHGFAMHCFAWLCIALRGFALLCFVFLYFSSPCIALVGFALLCLASHRMLSKKIRFQTTCLTSKRRESILRPLRNTKGFL